MGLTAIRPYFHPPGRQAPGHADFVCSEKRDEVVGQAGARRHPRPPEKPDLSTSKQITSAKLASFVQKAKRHSARAQFRTTAHNRAQPIAGAASTQIALHPPQGV
jgi:hypothetical protein